jgi:hypothetical protein
LRVSHFTLLSAPPNFQHGTAAVWNFLRVGGRTSQQGDKQSADIVATASADQQLVEDIRGRGEKWAVAVVVEH